MRILRIDVKDGRGAIDVAVRDEMEVSRLVSFLSEAWEAIEEKEERETQAGS